MNELLLFGTSVALSISAWAYVSIAYAWPILRAHSLVAGATPILVLHLFRFVGVAFLIKGVAGNSLPSGFAAPAAYGDLIAVCLAWLAIGLRCTKYFSKALLIFNIWGMADLLFAFYQGMFGVRIEAHALGATFFIPTVYVPVLLCSHIMVFALLIRRDIPGRQGLTRRST
jgi:hypothetical protein